MNRKALILGASGMVGRELAKLLIRQGRYAEIRLLVRRRITQLEQGCKQIVTDFDRLDEADEWFQADDVFCCLGTTMKRAGSRPSFRKVDFDYPLEAAKRAKLRGVEQFLIITAMGANPESNIFYSRVKGEVEKELHKLHFSSLHIFRPSLLLGEREEMRAGERLFGSIDRFIKPVMIGPLRKYRGIEASAVARAMANAAYSAAPGHHIYLSDEIERLSKS